MLYSDYPLFFNNTEIVPTRQNWSLNYYNIQNVHMTDAGYDDYEVIRRGRVEISASFQCTDRWAAILTRFNDHTMIDVKYYDIATKGYVTRTMHMEDLSVQEVRNSEKVQETNGLYVVSFSLLEF